MAKKIRKKRIIGKHWCGGNLILETIAKFSVKCNKCNRISYDTKRLLRG